jgi:uncharacterized protein (TIGR03437 family)
VYLYDSAQDEFIQGRQIFSNPIQGYFGPVGAGPGGRYFVVNGTVLNQALTPTGSAGAVQMQARPGAPAQTVPRPVSAVVPLSNTQYVRFAQPVLQQGNPLAAAAPTVELADAVSGNTMRSVSTVEGPISTVTGAARANVSGRTIAVDPAGTTAYALTASGLSVIPLDAVTPADRPQLAQQNAVVNIANQKPSISPGSIVSIQGRNLGEQASAGTDRFPSILGGVCVTLNNQPLPLAATSAGEIRAQVPTTVAAGRYPLVVRNVDRRVSSLIPVAVTLTKYAPAVLMDPETKLPAIYDDKGKPVSRQNPTTRDRRLTMFAVGLGPTKGATIPPGALTPETPAAVTDPVKVYFGDPRIREAEIAVEWSGLAPGLIGVYRIDLYVPWNRLRGEELDVTIRIGGVDSPTKGEMDPKIAVN